MTQIDRRSFIKTTASAGSILLVSPYLDGSLLGMPVAKVNGYFSGEFGIDQALCTLLLETALSRGGDYADVYFEHTLENWLSLEDGKVNQSYGRVKLGVGIRTVKGDQVGYGYTEELTRESMLSAAATAASLTSGQPIAAPEALRKPETANYYPLISPLEEVPLSSKLPLVKAINEKCFSKSNEIIKVNAGFHDSTKRIMVVTSDGVMAEDLIPRNYLYASAIAERNGRKEQSWWNVGGRY
ncbi:MAG: hypothetical protein JXB34_13030, partial [Bacteroidales bacterium]|nr:hypothetical protein [Bacteroidales bacterium]